MNDEILTAHLRDRPEQLQKARENGVKIIGYFPGNYVPEELIYASGAVPVCLISGGNVKPANAALSTVPEIICPFARTQIGEMLLKENPYYNLIDMLVAPITCRHLKQVTDIFEYLFDDMEIFKLGVPHEYHMDFEAKYYVNRLKMLKQRLETFTGNEITDKKIQDAIELYNRMRKLLREISMTRRKSPSPINSVDFIRLNHASFYADPIFMTDFLESVHEEIENNPQDQKGTGSPRLLLIGPNVSDHDYKIIDLINNTGGELVIEEVCEGIRYYWRDIGTKGDLFQSLSRGYLTDRIPCAFMVDSTKKRFDFTMELIKDFNISAVIWYELLCCETYDSEAYYFEQKLREHNIPMLMLESDYGTSDEERFRVRLEALMEMIKGGIEL